MAITPQVVADAPILASWGNEIRDRTVQQFASAAERSAQWPSPPDGAVSFLRDVDRLQIYDLATTAWRTPGAPYDRKQRASTDITINSTSWANLDTALDITLPAAAGDVIEVALSAFTEASTGDLILNVDCVTSGTGFGPNTATGFGILAWYSPGQAVYTAVGGSYFRTLVAGDISAGNVILRLRVRQNIAGAKVIDASVDRPLTFFARNLGPDVA